MIINLPPLADGLVDQRGRATSGMGQWLMQVFRICFDVQNSGTTGQRPTTNLYVGKPYFDTTLGFPVWWTGPAVGDWVDSTGAPA